MTDAPDRPVDAKPSLSRRLAAAFSEAQIIAIAASSAIIFGFLLLWLIAPAHVSIAVLWALACLSVGATVGFMFGIPRVLQSDSASSNGPPQYRVNSSLEQIADWLTKIIVGLGLVHANKVVARLDGLAAYVGNAFPELRHAEVFALALLLYFAVFGFVCAYLLTRVFLVPTFKKADSA